MKNTELWTHRQVSSLRTPTWNGLLARFGLFWWLIKRRCFTPQPQPPQIFVICASTADNGCVFNRMCVVEQQEILNWITHTIAAAIKVTLRLALWDSKSRFTLLQSLRSQQWFRSEDSIFVSYVSKAVSPVTPQTLFLYLMQTCDNFTLMIVGSCCLSSVKSFSLGK